MQKDDFDNVVVFLRRNALGTISSINADNEVDTANVYFRVEDDLTLYFVTKEQTRKFGNITERNTVTLSVVDEAGLCTAEIKGTASVVNESEDISETLLALHKEVEERGSGYWIPPIGRLDAGPFVVVKIAPSHVRYIAYGSDSKVEVTPPTVVDFAINEQ